MGPHLLLQTVIVLVLFGCPPTSSLQVTFECGCWFSRRWTTMIQVVLVYMVPVADLTSDLTTLQKLFDNNHFSHSYTLLSLKPYLMLDMCTMCMWIKQWYDWNKLTNRWICPWSVNSRSIPNQAVSTFMTWLTGMGLDDLDMTVKSSNHLMFDACTVPSFMSIRQCLVVWPQMNHDNLQITI